MAGAGGPGERPTTTPVESEWPGRGPDTPAQHKENAGEARQLESSGRAPIPRDPHKTDITSIILYLRNVRPPSEDTEDDTESEEGEEERDAAKGGKWRIEGSKQAAEKRQRDAPYLARNALVPKTLAKHETVLQRLLSTTIHTSIEDLVAMHPLFLAKMAAEFLWERKRTSHIKWSTLETEAGTLMGALARRGADIAKEPLWKDTLTGIKRRAARQAVAWPLIFTPQEVHCLIHSAANEQRIFLVLAFGGGMRPSDLFSATVVDTVIYERHVALVIRGGKQSKETPRTVHIITSEFHASVIHHIRARARQEEPNLFTDSRPFRESIRNHLRRVHPAASLRSFRSTTLITMGLLGAPASTIQALATHTSPQTTQRYLRFGAANAHAATAQSGFSMLEQIAPSAIGKEGWSFIFEADLQAE